MTHQWNPRFVNYARAHGRTPEAQLAQENSMVDFTQWNTARLNEAPKEFFFCGGLTDHKGYDAWLTAWVDERTKT